MIDGKLTDMERDLRNVKVIVGTDSRGQAILFLRDIDGVFVDAGTIRDESGDSPGDGDSDVDVCDDGEEPGSEHGDEYSAEELEKLRTQNATLSFNNPELAAQVSSLEEEVRDMLGKESERVCMRCGE